MKIIFTLSLLDEDIERLKIDPAQLDALFRVTMNGVVENLENAWAGSEVEARANVQVIQ